MIDQNSSAASEEIESMSSAESVDSSAEESNAVETHRSALCCLNIQLREDEHLALTSVWDAELRGIAEQNQKAMEEASTEKGELLKSIAFRLAGEARDQLATLDGDGWEREAMVAAAEWLVARCEDGFEADEANEFLNLIIQGR